MYSDSLAWGIVLDIMLVAPPNLIHRQPQFGCGQGVTQGIVQGDIG